MTEKLATETKEAPNKAGKYLTFVLGQEEFGLEILKVREIIGAMDVTAVPLTPAFIKGIINLRGRIIPVMDLRRKFGMPPADRTASTCIIVVFVGNTEIGVIVDSVSEVLDVAAEEIEDAPSFGSAVDTHFLLGIGKTGGKVTILLDIEKTLTDQDLTALAGAAA